MRVLASKKGRNPKLHASYKKGGYPQVRVTLPGIDENFNLNENKEKDLEKSPLLEEEMTEDKGNKSKGGTSKKNG